MRMPPIRTGAPGGSRTPTHWVRSPALYPLSYGRTARLYRGWCGLDGNLSGALLASGPLPGGQQAGKQPCGATADAHPVPGFAAVPFAAGRVAIRLTLPPETRGAHAAG